MNPNIKNYLESHALALRNSFERIRRTHGDSDVKGGHNERIVSDFLREHSHADSIVQNAEVIDFNGERSGEMDILLCNKYQPFRSESPEIVIVEAVDLCVQVKAVLNDAELDRVFKNCQSLKKLTRTYRSDDFRDVMKEKSRAFVGQPPYFVIAFESELSWETLLKRFVEKKKSVAPENQPDLIAWLDKGLLLNLRDGEPFGVSRNEELATGTAFLEYRESTLIELMRWVHVLPPRIEFRKPPIEMYLGLMLSSAKGRIILD